MADQDPKAQREDEIHRRSRAYKGISFGTTLICLGGVLLLNTLDTVDWGVWFDLVKLWPLLLISAGVRMIFVGTPLHPLSLLGPLLVLVSTTALVVTHGDRAERWAEFRAAGSRRELSCPAPPEGEPARLDLTLSGGEIRLVADPPGEGKDAQPIGLPARPARPEATAVAAGIRGVMTYEGRDPRPVCGDSGDLRLGRRGGKGIHLIFPFQGDRERWEAHLSSPAPVELSLSLAAAEADLDLRAFSLHGIDLDAGASSIVLRLGAPKGRVPVRVQGGVVSLSVFVPEGTCYTLRRDKTLGILDAEDLPEKARRRRRVSSTACGSPSTDPGAPVGEDAAQYEITLELPLSRVVVASETGAP